jgi:carbon monoxide dehydrogenase subunit G
LGRIEKSIEIKASPAKVWEMLALDRLPEWNEEYGDVKYTSEVRSVEDKYRVGARSHTNMKGAGANDFEVTESLENEKMTFRMLGKRANSTVVTYVLESVEEGTKLYYVMTYELPWGIIGKFFGKLVKSTLKKEAEKSIEKLKSILEK